MEGIEMIKRVISFAAIRRGHEQSLKDLEAVHLQHLQDVEMRHQWSKQELVQDLNTRLRKAYWALVKELREWLDETMWAEDVSLTEFFCTVRDEYDGKLVVCLEAQAFSTKGFGTITIPHPVHFREGMAVRNKLRDLTGCEWSAIEYDERWVEITLDAIKE